MRTLRVRSALNLSFVLLAAFSPARAADTSAVTGTVRNETNHRLVAGVDVVLVRLENGMQEEARTKTDSQGAFGLSLRNPGVPHLLRVVYQSVGYYQPVSGNEPIEVEVFNAAAEVSGVSGKAEIVRIASNGNSLHVSDMYEIENSSNPPITQAGSKSFEFFLPAEAKPDSVLAAAPGGMVVITSARRIGNTPGHWAVDFPLRPGATKFSVNYDRPYLGHAAFQPNIAYPTRQVAVMMPMTMSFSSDASGFHPLENGSSEFQVEVINSVRPGEIPSFQVSGSGSLPPIGGKIQSLQTIKGAPNGSHQEAATLSAMSRIREVVMIFGLLAFVAAWPLIWFVRRTKRKAHAPVVKFPLIGESRMTGLEPLKQRLLELEVARLSGSISAEIYASRKQGLEETITHTNVQSH